MPLIEHTMYGKIDKVKIAIERTKAFDPITTGFMDTPYYVAYSGGKDSDVIRILCDLAGVKHDLWHNHTTVDAPETVRYIRSIPNINISYPELTMWELIVKKMYPPTRVMRYCCSELKERNGTGRFVMTGVRWSESSNRKNKRGGLEVFTSNLNNKLILNADNDENRRLFETCQLKGKRVINPIIDWTEDDVWEFLNHYGCKSNPLYQCGYKRVGCVGCPMSTRQKYELEVNYPKYKVIYIHAFDRMLLAMDEKGIEHPTWKTGEDVYNWWVDNKKQDQIDPNQLSFMDMESA